MKSCCETQTRTLSGVRTPRGPLSLDLLVLFNTTRTLSGPPSTRAAIAMDGGVADTACYYTGR